MITDKKILDIRKESIRFAHANNLMLVQCWTRTKTETQREEVEGKAPVVGDWNTLEVLQKYQEVWTKQFLNGEKNLGFVCGYGGLMVLDMDNAETWEKLGKDLKDTTTHIKTGKGNDQLYFKVLDPQKGFREHGDPISMDLQGKGCFVVAPGSVNQVTQDVYTFANTLNIAEWPAKIDMIVDIKNKIFDKFGIVIKDKYVVSLNKIAQGVKKGDGRDRAAFDLATYYRREKKMTAEQTLDELQKWDTRNKPPLEETEPGSLVKCVESAYSYDAPCATTFTDDEIYTDIEVQKAQELLDSPGQIFWWMRKSCPEHYGDNKAIVMGQLLRLANITNRVLGPSGAGKSHMIDTYILNFPKSWVTKITSGTSSSIRYMGDQIPCLYIAEERGTEAPASKGASGENNMQYDMKMAMSEGFILNAIPEKDEHGHIKTVFTKTLVGCFIVSTTKADKASVEYTNRLMETVVDASVEQTQAVIKKTTKLRTMFKDEKVDPTPLHRQMRCLMQRIYAENMKLEVVIPWASALDPILLADKTASCRRFVDKMDKILVSVAQIMAADCAHYTRPDGTAYIIPGPEIGWYAWQIANDAIFMQMADLEPMVKEVWEALLTIFADEGKKQLTYTEIKSRLRHKCPTLGTAVHAQALKTLADTGYLSMQSQAFEVSYKLGFMVDPNASDPVFLRDLELATKEWVERQPECPPIPHPDLIHPFTGQRVIYDSNYRLTQELLAPKIEIVDMQKQISQKVKDAETAEYEAMERI